MMRNDSGHYTCIAINKHGRSTAEALIDVQCKLYDWNLVLHYAKYSIYNVLDKPRCEIERREIDDLDTLICTAYGNPEEVNF